MTSYATRIAEVAGSQYASFHGVNANDPPLRNQIKQYWSDLGMADPGAGAPWGAVFVAWCVTKAGVTDFAHSISSGRLVYRAIQNTVNSSGVMRAVASSYPREIRVGDITQINRVDQTFDFDYASAHYDYASHLAVVVEAGTDGDGRFVKTVRGNE